MDSTSLSLVERVGNGSQDAWQRLDSVYRPLIHNWLQRFSVPAREADDVAQEVLIIVLRKIGGFSHTGRTGAFRNWLRQITAHKARESWRAGKLQVPGDKDFDQVVEELEDADSELSRQWDEEHDRYVVARLLELILTEFELTTQEAFKKYVVEGNSARQVAEETGLSLQAVYIAKSRVLKRLREEALGLSNEYSFR